MIAIFLDFDGVINSKPYRDANPSVGELEVDPACIARLNRIVEATGAKFILTTTWRGARTPEEWQKHLHEGFGFIGEIVSRTDDNPKSRLGQIDDWIEEHDALDDYIILDDIDMINDKLPWLARIKPRLMFVTDDMFGLTDEMTDRIIARLQSPDSQ